MQISDMAQDDLPSRQPSGFTGLEDFYLFVTLPVEIRVKIWEAALAPRIVRWIRGTDGSVFTAPSGSLPLLSVCQESRSTAFFYAQYRVLAGLKKVYFSPVLDYLWIDPGWTKPYVSDTVLDDRHDTLREQFGEVQNIMVHPNWSGERKEPAVSMANVPSIKRILVAADEKSIGIRSSIMLDTVQDLKYYYYNFHKENAATKMPYIAVGCLGWVGLERRSIWHGSEDKRQLLMVFENYGEMKNHLAYLREEQWKFIQQQRSQSKGISGLFRMRRTEAAGPPTISNASRNEGKISSMFADEPSDEDEY